MTVRHDRARGRGTAGGVKHRIAWYTVLIAIGLVIAAPLLWMLSTSLKTQNDATTVPPSLLPRELSGEGYRKVVAAEETPVLRWFLNSLLAASLHAILVLVVASLAAYALARMTFPGRRLLFAIVVGTLFVPPLTLLIPNYLIVDELGWLDTVTALVVPGAASAFGVFFLRQFLTCSRTKITVWAGKCLYSGTFLPNQRS